VIKHLIDFFGPYDGMPEDQKPDQLYRLEIEFDESKGLSIDFDPDGKIYIHCMDGNEDFDRTIDLSDWIAKVSLGEGRNESKDQSQS
jgi:hypothetical protein